jgi:hypothetical protein
MANENTRIYVVTEADKARETPLRHLVRAGSQAQAIRHIATPRFTAEVAEQDELVELVGAGVKVQTASAA